MENEKIWMIFALFILLTVGIFKMTEAPIDEYELEVDDQHRAILTSDTPEEFKLAVDKFIEGDSNHYRMNKAHYPQLIHLRDNVNETNLASSQQALAGTFADEEFASGWWAVRVVMAGITLVIGIVAIGMWWD
jgi:hypothetical protein